MITNSPTSPPPGGPKVKSGATARAVTLREQPTESRYSQLPTSYPLIGLRSPSTIRAAYRAQQADRQSKAELDSARVSRSEPDQVIGQGSIPGYADPPFDLDRLADMLFDSDTYYAVINQFAVDSCSAWSLVDTDEGAPAAGGEVDPSLGLDDAAKEQRAVAEKQLDAMCFDFDDQHVSLVTFCQTLLKDRDATGNAHCEIVRDETSRPKAYVHVPSRLIRRGVDGRTFCQVDEMGRAVAFFRRYGAVVDPIDANGDSETPWAYVTKDEASLMASVLPPGQQPVPGQRENDPKRELTDFKIYHPRERYYGIPPIIAAFNSLVGNIMASNRNVRFFVNRGMPDYVIMIKAPAEAFTDPVTLETVIDPLENSLAEHMKYMLEGEDHRALIARIPTGEYELVFERVGDLPSDQEWGQYQKDNRDNIIHVYGMMPKQLGIIETASIGTGSGESQDETYKRSQIEPRQEMFEAFWDLQLDELGFHAVRHQFHEYDVLDEQREATIAIGFAGTGAFSINDIRAWASRIIKDQDFPPEDLEGADVPIKLLDLMTAGMLAGAEGGIGAPVVAAGIRPASGIAGAINRLAGLAGIRGGDGQSGLQALQSIRAGTGALTNGVPPDRNADRRRIAGPNGAQGGVR
jgi:capsid portal protein